MEKQHLKERLKDKKTQLLILLLIFATIIRIYYFFKLGLQPVWWDEGDYLAISKVWALGMEIPEWWAHFTGMRPLLLPFIWTAFFKLGLGELSIRFFTILLPSLGTIYLMFLLGKDLYDSRVGLAASLMMASYWVFLFYSFRLLTDIPSVFFGMLSFYFFWSFYINKKKPLGLYLMVLFGVLAFSTRFALALVPIICAIYLFSVKRLSVFKDKTVWKAGFFLIVLLLPYIVYFISTKFFLFQFYFGDRAVSMQQPMAWNLIPLLGELLHSFWLACFIVGLFTFWSLFIGFDIFFKQKNNSLNSDFFVLLWLVVHLIFYIVIFRTGNDRWLLMLMPPIFFIASKGIFFLSDLSKKYSKYIPLFIIAVLLIGGAYQNLTHAHELIISKKDSYREIQSSGLWLKQNTSPDSKIITASIVQNQYYSERRSYDFFTNSSIWQECSNLLGKLSESEECQRATKEEFNKKVQEIDPDYLIISVFEPVFTPQWAYTYGPETNMTIVAGFPQGQQPILVVFKFN